MRRKDYKGRCEKRSVSKSKDVCRLYDDLQKRYLEILQSNDNIAEIRCNVILDGIEENKYMSDFVCTMSNGEILVRECVFRSLLTKPKTVRLLDLSKKFWLNHGILDWGIVTNEEK